METTLATLYYDACVSILLWTAITITLATGWIFDRPKTWIVNHLDIPYDTYAAKLMYCPQCLGFWVGFIGAVICWPIWLEQYFHCPYLVGIAQGFIISFTSYLVGSYTNLDEESEHDGE